MRAVRLTALAVVLAMSAACSDSTPVGEDDDLPSQAADTEVPVFDYSREPNREPVAVTDEAGCNAGLAEPFIGEEATAETRGLLLSAVAPIVNVRWIDPSEEENSDVDPRRLTIMLDEAGAIQSVECG